MFSYLFSNCSCSYEKTISFLKYMKLIIVLVLKGCAHSFWNIPISKQFVHTIRSSLMHRFINDHWNQLKGFLSLAISHTDLYEWMEGKALRRTFSLLKLAINLSWLPRHCMAAHARFSHQTILFVGFCPRYKIVVLCWQY